MYSLTKLDKSFKGVTFNAEEVDIILSTISIELEYCESDDGRKKLSDIVFKLNHLLKN